MYEHSHVVAGDSMTGLADRGTWLHDSTAVEQG